MDTQDFFSQISKPIDGQTQVNLIAQLYNFTKGINSMTPDELIAFFQALRILKNMQPVYIKFKRNALRERVIDTQLIVIETMRKHTDYSDAFNRVIEDEWIRGQQYRIYPF